MKKLTKEMGLRVYIKEKQDTEQLMKLTKEELVERYKFRIDKALSVGFILGMVVTAILTIIAKHLVLVLLS